MFMWKLLIKPHDSMSTFDVITVNKKERRAFQCVLRHLTLNLCAYPRYCFEALYYVKFIVSLSLSVTSSYILCVCVHCHLHRRCRRCCCRRRLRLCRLHYLHKSHCWKIFAPSISQCAKRILWDKMPQLSNSML